ncbi:MAG: hypothetical protein R2793_01580 [Flavobacteriaceae bacterium]
MKLFFAIPLSILLLLQSTSIGVGDLLKLNYLIEHAQYHSEQYGDSLFVFLSKHYGELKKDHLEYPHEGQGEHEKLPFNHHSCHHFSPVFVLLPLDGFEGKNTEFAARTEAYFFYKEPYSSPYKSGIFQPPKHA